MKEKPAGTEHRLGSYAAIFITKSWSCVVLQGGVPLSSPPSTAGTSDLINCQRISSALRYCSITDSGPLLRLALAERWFLWQLQRQMKGWLQPRHRQPGCPRMFPPKCRQTATRHSRMDPAVTAPAGSGGVGAMTPKTFCKCSFLNRFQLSPRVTPPADGAACPSRVPDAAALCQDSISRLSGPATHTNNVPAVFSERSGIRAWYLPRPVRSL